MEKRVAHCHLIAGLLASDAVMTEEERAFLNRCMDSLGLTDEERDQVKHFEGAEEAEATMKALPEADRRALVDDLVAAALADGQLTPAEMALVKKLTDSLGL